MFTEAGRSLNCLKMLALGISGGVAEEVKVPVVYTVGRALEQLGDIACPEQLIQNFLTHVIYQNAVK